MRRLSLIAALLVAPAAGAQTIEPGMSREQVVERLGRPSGERETSGFTYLFFRNGCERRCGMSDLVILEGDAVVDALFRKPGRRFAGASSSPPGTRPEPTNTVASGQSGDHRAGARAEGARADDADAGADGRGEAQPIRGGGAAPGGRPGGLVFSRPATPQVRVQSGDAGSGAQGQGGGTVQGAGGTRTGGSAGAATRVNAGPTTGVSGGVNAGVGTGGTANEVPLATPPTVTPPTVTPPTGSIPAQGAAPAPTNAPASTAGPAAPNTRAPTATPRAPSSTRPDTGSNPTPATGTTPPAGGTAPPGATALDRRLQTR